MRVREERNAVAVQGHSCGAGDAVRDVLHHLCRPGQHRHGGRRNSEGTRLSNTQLGLVFSVFAYPYLLFQVIGGWVGDRFGPRRTLFWCGMIWAAATIMTGFVNGLLTLFVARVMLGFGEGATFPTATRAMQYWTPAGRRGFAQGITHSFARFGNAVTPPLVAWLMALYTWRGSFVILGSLSLIWVLVWLWYFRDEPQDHSG